MSTVETYTPGMRGAKIAAVLLGGLVFVIGISWVWKPIVFAIRGGKAEAEVSAVISSNPAEGEKRLISRRDILRAEDMTRNTVFRYEVRYTDEQGNAATGLLNYGQYIRPIHTVGDRIQIAYDRSNPEELLAIRSIRTWAFGMFFTVIGLLLVITQSIILYHANQPIVIDSIAELDS